MILSVESELFFQNAVNPITDPGNILQGFDVNIAGPVLDRVLQYFFNNLDDFRLFDDLGHRFDRDYPRLLFLPFAFFQDFADLTNQTLGVILINQ